MRKIAAHQISVSDVNTFTFTITFPVNTRMKFVMSGDELISMKETLGPCEGRGTTWQNNVGYTCVCGWLAVLWNLWKVVDGPAKRHRHDYDLMWFGHRDIVVYGAAGGNWSSKWIEHHKCLRVNAGIRKSRQWCRTVVGRQVVPL